MIKTGRSIASDGNVSHQGMCSRDYRGDIKKISISYQTPMQLLRAFDNYQTIKWSGIDTNVRSYFESG
jgi:hypothetical protein